MAESKEPKCQPCVGTGKVPLTFDIVPGRMPAELMEIDCPKCGGTGRLYGAALPITKKPASRPRGSVFGLKTGGASFIIVPKVTAPARWVLVF